jgi:hypothetical protein
MKANAPAIILGVAIVIAAIIYALSTRYEVVPDTQQRDAGAYKSAPMVLDRWTGKTK